MSYLLAVSLGAGLGVLQLGYKWLKRPTVWEYPFQAIAFMAVVGGLVYGTIIWLIAKIFA